jgi:hypothetical protein
VRFHIQEGAPADWQRLVDTNLESPLDIVKPGKESTLCSLDYDVAPRSIVVLSGHSSQDGDGDDIANLPLTGKKAPLQAAQSRQRSRKSKT